MVGVEIDENNLFSYRSNGCSDNIFHQKHESYRYILTTTEKI